MSTTDLSQFYINGRWVAPSGRDTLDIVNPATEESVAVLAMGDASDVDTAVAAAKAARPAFATTTKPERRALLERILDVFSRRIDEMAQAISIEMGAPISFAREQQAQVGVDILTAMVADLEAFAFEHTLPNGDLIVMEPVGVCGLITPWNWPVNQMMLKIAPCLAAGCTMVLKPSELTPLSANLLAEIMDEAGAPAGVFNLIHGAGSTVGSAMSRHPDIAMMSFTGSTRAGTSILKESADTVKRVTLELGGKSPNLVFADCELERAIDEGIDACFINSGQSCDAATRMLVERPVYDRAVELAAAKCARVKIGDPSQPGDQLGPLVSEMQYDRVQKMIQVGLDENARLVCGGLGKPEGFETGYYAKPTVFADVSNGMRIAQEEIFGPVLVMIPFDDEEDGIRLANDTPYGLGAYVQSGDPARALRVAKALQSGTVNVNGAYLAAGSPFGGYKSSGNGREGGAEGMRDFLEVKAIALPD